MIIKVDDNSNILDFFVGTDTPTCEGIEYDETKADIADFIANWRLYSYKNGALFKDTEKVKAYKAEMIAQTAEIQLQNNLLQLNASLDEITKKINECAAAAFIDEPAPYNIAELKATRTSLKAQIAELESEANGNAM